MFRQSRQATDATRPSPKSQLLRSPVPPFLLLIVDKRRSLNGSRLSKTKQEIRRNRRIQERLLTPAGTRGLARTPIAGAPAPKSHLLRSPVPPFLLLIFDKRRSLKRARRPGFFANPSASIAAPLQIFWIDALFVLFADRVATR
jgi:hypothetical protein